MCCCCCVSTANCEPRHLSEILYSLNNTSTLRQTKLSACFDSTELCAVWIPSSKSKFTNGAYDLLVCTRLTILYMRCARIMENMVGPGRDLMIGFLVCVMPCVAATTSTVWGGGAIRHTMSGCTILKSGSIALGTVRRL